MRNFPANFKVGIDSRMLAHSGIGVRLYHILNEFSKIKDKPEIYLMGNPELIRSYPSLNSFPIIPYFANIYSIKELFGIPQMNDFQILDIPHFNFPIRYLNRCIITIHDLTPYVMRDYFPSKLKRIYLEIIFRLLRFSKKVITVSQFTSNDLIKYFHFYDTSIVYNAVDTNNFYPRKLSEIQEFKYKYGLPQEYYLCVGIGKGHKNFSFLIDSFRHRYLNNEFIIPIVIAGTGGILPEELIEKIIGIEKYIICAPKFNYNELSLLYAGANCLIYPSLYEGFGLPLLEAQASGCPVVSSSSSVMPEILGNSALYFDPTNSIELYDSILRLKSISNDLVHKGNLNYKRYSWNKSANQILDIYSEFSEKEK